MLNHAYQRSLRTAEQDSLRSQIYVLLGAAEPTTTGIQLPPVLLEPRYSSVSSGLMGWVVDREGQLQWRSSSSELLDTSELPLETTEFRPGRERFFSTLIGGREYYAISYDTLWDISGSERGFRFAVMLNREPMYNELNAYQKRLWKWLGGLAFLMIIVQTLIARWGLQPLRTLASDLEKVEEGSQQSLSGRYPADIQPVTDNLNRVLLNEMAQRERYRNTLSDLAHSLKTPLAVIRGHLESGGETKQLATLINEQISRMSSIVDHQLRRANAQVIQASPAMVNIRPTVERLIHAMHKVYAHKKLNFTLDIPARLDFHGDEADFMELIGNLIDNACKYGRRYVTIRAHKIDNDLEIIIADDGPGVAADAKKIILTRGARADTAAPGQGIGLAVAVDILSSYGGSIDIIASELGGAGFKLRIPNWMT